MRLIPIVKNEETFLRRASMISVRAFVHVCLSELLCVLVVVHAVVLQGEAQARNEDIKLNDVGGLE